MKLFSSRSEFTMSGTQLNRRELTRRSFRRRLSRVWAVEQLEGRTLLSIGDLDPTFGNGGVVIDHIPSSSSDAAESMAVQADGKIVVVGHSSSNNPEALPAPNSDALARYNVDGTLDTSFGTGGRVLFPDDFSLATGSHAVAVQLDGKILVVGSTGPAPSGPDFAEFSSDFAVERFDSDGALDTTFGLQGQATADILSHLGPSSVDRGYASLKPTSGDTASSLALQPDGKIVVAGSSRIYTGVSVGGDPAGDFASDLDYAVARFDANGQLDPTFGGGGTAAANLGTYTGSTYTINDRGLRLFNSPVEVKTLDEAHCVMLQSDGGIVLGGTSITGWTSPPYPGSPQPIYNAAVVRFSGDGTVDSSYGAGVGSGYHALAPGTLNDLVLGPDGKIVFAGADGLSTSGIFGSDLVGVISSDGRSLERSAIIPRAGTVGYQTVAVQSDGRIVASSFARPFGDGGESRVDRLLADCTPDANFGLGGEIASIPNPRSLALQPDGMILVMGGESDFVVARYGSVGLPDSQFGVGGISSVNFRRNLRDLNPDGIAILPDGKIVSMGFSDTQLYFTRHNSDGSLDATFGDGGVAFTAVSGPNGITRMALQADGKIVVATVVPGADSTSDFAIFRFGADGSPDASFGAGGMAQINFGEQSDDYPAGLVIQPDGKILIAGNADAPDGNLFALARIGPDGSLDEGFGIGGEVTTNIAPGFSVTLSAIALQEDGTIVAAGHTSLVSQTGVDADGNGIYVSEQHFALARYTSDGSLDDSFQGDTIHSSAGQDDLSDVGVDVQPDGKIVLAGLADGRGGPLLIQRYNPDFSPDGSFGTGGEVFDSFVVDGSITRVLFQPDGKMIALGSSVVPGSRTAQFGDGRPELALARYNEDGSPDASFGNGGMVTTDVGWPPNSSQTISDATILTDGSILVLGGTISLARYQGLLQVDPATITAQLQGIVATLQQAGAGQSVTLQSITASQVSSAISAVNGLQSVDPTKPVTVVLELGGQSITTDTRIDAPAGVTLVIQHGTLIGGSPALIVDTGNVILDGVTAVNATNAPTILVNGGSLIVRNSTIQESSGFAQAAIWITGGLVDLGTASNPGGNILNVNGVGELVHNASDHPVSAIGDTFTINGAHLTPSSLSGVVFADFNDDGQVDFGEQGIAGVTVKLDGIDFLGNSVHSSLITDSAGAYVFLNLLPGSYTITETQQPAGYTPGIATVGTGGGTVSGAQFTVSLSASVDAMNYNYGELPAATGAVHSGQTAGIGFWNNKNGQALIKALNGGATSTQLGNWLAATFPHMFGSASGSNSLAGKNNASVASFFQSRFVVKDQKLDAQVLATALAVYVTDGTLDNTGVGTQYGFTVSGNGVATATINVGTNGAAFGVADSTVMTVMDILLAADAQAVNGVLYAGNTTKRNQANNVFSAINEIGGI